jgi:hypothetical protein
VAYTSRHTFLTRLGESGCDVWTRARIAGQSSISISSRYVHPSHDAVLSAISRVGGHNSGHYKELAIPTERLAVAPIRPMVVTYKAANEDALFQPEMGMFKRWELPALRNSPHLSNLPCIPSLSNNSGEESGS